MLKLIVFFLLSFSVSANANSLRVNVTVDNYKIISKLKSNEGDTFHFLSDGASFNKIKIVTAKIDDNGLVMKQHQDEIEQLATDEEPTVLSFNFDTKMISFGGDYYETEPLDDDGYFRVKSNYSSEALMNDIYELLDKNQTKVFARICPKVSVPQVFCRFNDGHSLECETRNISVSFLYTNDSCPKDF